MTINELIETYNIQLCERDILHVPNSEAVKHNGVMQEIMSRKTEIVAALKQSGAPVLSIHDDLRNRAL